MRGTVTKRLRNQARVDSAPTKWTFSGWVKKVVRGIIGPVEVMDTVRCTGYRRVYQDLKKAYKTGR